MQCMTSCAKTECIWHPIRDQSNMCHLHWYLHWCLHWYLLYLRVAVRFTENLHLAELIPCRRAAPSLGLDCFCHKVVFVHCSGPRRLGDFSLHHSPFSSFFFKAREHVFSIHWYNRVYTCIYIILNLLPSNRFASVKQINLNPFQVT